MVSHAVNTQSRGASQLSEMIGGYESKGGAYPKRDLIYYTISKFRSEKTIFSRI